MNMQVRAMLAAAMLCAVGIGGAALGSEGSAGDTYRIPYDKLLAGAEEYLAAFASEKDLRNMERRLKRHVDTKVDDNPIMTRDRAMREIMLDWAAGNRSKLMKKDPKAMTQGCFFFKRFIEKRFLMPNMIRNELTEEVVKEILDTLHAEAVKKRGKNEKK